MVVDCLYDRGRDLLILPLEERRAVLEEEITGCDLIHPARRLPDHGLEACSDNSWESWWPVLKDWCVKPHHWLT